MQTAKKNVQTSKRTEFIDITRELNAYLRKNNCKSGIMTVFTPHTTAAITINENADPDVPRDLSRKINEMIPKDEHYYRHYEGNSDSHMKSSLFSPSLNLIVEDGKLILGIWQAVFFCEFDGPRNRNYFIKVMEDA
ncbi:MAG: secondary thiamine-phosphate synthase enzyme YjbQ [Candidatus Neomarinimicrobiota bacterium]